MEKLIYALFGTAERKVVSLTVIAVLLLSSGASNLRISFNEDYAAETVDMLDASTLNAQIAGRCYGGRTPRIFLTWPSIAGTIQKQTNGGTWMSLINSDHKTFYADWDVTLGTPYAYRIKKSPKVFSNAIKVRPTAESCTSIPVATIASVTVPGHDAPFYPEEVVRLSVMGEPNRPVQWCTQASATTTQCIPASPSFTTKTDSVSGTWSTDMVFHDAAVGSPLKYWFVVANQKSNVLQFSVIAPPTVTDGVTATSGSSMCDGTVTPIALAWNATAGAASYIVRRSDTSGGPYTIVQSGVTTTTYADQDARGTYYYVITSVDQYGRESGYSSEVEAGFATSDCR